MDPLPHQDIKLYIKACLLKNCFTRFGKIVACQLLFHQVMGFISLSIKHHAHGYAKITTYQVIKTEIRWCISEKLLAFWTWFSFRACSLDFTLRLSFWKTKYTTQLVTKPHDNDFLCLTTKNTHWLPIWNENKILAGEVLRILGKGFYFRVDIRYLNTINCNKYVQSKKNMFSFESLPCMIPCCFSYRVWNVIRKCYGYNISDFH